jgi:hypothetical protein
MTDLERDLRDMMHGTADGVHHVPRPSRGLVRRARLRRVGTAALAGTAVLALVIGGFAGARSLSRDDAAPVPPAEDTKEELGIFEPLAGRIVSGLWAVDPIAVDPSAPSRSRLVRLGPELGPEEVLLLGWSSDGTELLFMREDPTDQTFPYARHLYILHADGSETRLNREPMDFEGAAISPDGERVVFAADGLYVVDAEGGRPVRIAGAGSSPTFSPDGTRIAYLSFQAGRDHVWVANADGTNAHEILADEPALAIGQFGLTWSPAGDRIAMENTSEGHVAIYTFAPDGSDFTKVITGGFNPYWSPDGSQIAYALPGRTGLLIADADGSNVRTFDFGNSGPWHPGE